MPNGKFPAFPSLSIDSQFLLSHWFQTLDGAHAYGPHWRLFGVCGRLNAGMIDFGREITSYLSGCLIKTLYLCSSLHSCSLFCLAPISNFLQLINSFFFSRPSSSSLLPFLFWSVTHTRVSYMKCSAGVIYYMVLWHSGVYNGLSVHSSFNVNHSLFSFQTSGSFEII